MTGPASAGLGIVDSFSEPVVPSSRHSRHSRRALAALALSVALGACGASDATSPERQTTPVAIASAEQFLEIRIAALEAFRGTRAALDTSFVTHTIEGQPIVTRVEATRGRAVITRDDRADGGSVRSETVGALELVWVKPGEWVNNVEVRKEQYIVVAPAQARATPGQYYLRGRCTGGGECEMWV